MRILPATELARNLRRVLDSLEHGGEEIVVVRNGNPVAKLMPGAPRMSAIEVLGDLHRTIGEEEGADWLGDLAGAQRRWA